MRVYYYKSKPLSKIWMINTPLENSVVSIWRNEEKIHAYSHEGSENQIRNQDISEINV